MSFVERVWYGDDTLARTTRLLLRPAELMYRGVVSRRNARFDAQDVEATSRSRLLPAVSIGNLTVGGTGKTPIAAWCVKQLRQRGANPAIVMRGYGDDEWRVHTKLNPGTQVVVSPDRVGGMITARTRGADCAVLDDAFQHRRAPRIVDIVLISVDSWTDEVRLLPAGPYREGLESLSRASLVILTRKTADDAATIRVTRAIEKASSRLPLAVARFAPGNLRLAAALAAQVPEAQSRTPEPQWPVSWLAGKRIVALSAIGNPASFEAQLREAGAFLQDARRYRDHHVFSVADAEDVARRAQGADGVVCTLKDAVKLATLWPRQAPPLWYVSQTVVIDRGADLLEASLQRVLADRPTTLHTAG